MWKVTLPATDDIDAQLDAGLIQSNGTVIHALTHAERDELHILYELYDLLLGEPDEALQPDTLSGCADALHTAYGQVQKGGRLAALRSKLLSAVLECPLCGSGPATTLDHHLPHETYRALSINPRNLVPGCQPCNRAKGTLQPIAGQGLIHAYFQAIPAVTFLRANAAYASGSLEVIFSIAPAAVGDDALAERLEFQLTRLKLNDRHRDAINVFLFLFGLRPAFEFFRGLAQERELIKSWLTKAGDTYDRDLGRNHWRAAVVRALAACDAFLDDPWAYFDRPPPALAAAL